MESKNKYTEKIEIANSFLNSLEKNWKKHDLKTLKEKTIELKNKLPKRSIFHLSPYHKAEAQTEIEELKHARKQLRKLKREIEELEKIEHENKKASAELRLKHITKRTIEELKYSLGTIIKLRAKTPDKTIFKQSYKEFFKTAKILTEKEILAGDILVLVPTKNIWKHPAGKQMGRIIRSIQILSRSKLTHTGIYLKDRQWIEAIPPAPNIDSIDGWLANSSFLFFVYRLNDKITPNELKRLIKHFKTWRAGGMKYDMKKEFIKGTIQCLTKTLGEPFGNEGILFKKDLKNNIPMSPLCQNLVELLYNSIGKPIVRGKNAWNVTTTDIINSPRLHFVGFFNDINPKDKKAQEEFFKLFF